MRSDGKRVTREASRATGTFLFFPKGALTHHLVGTDSISLALPFGQSSLIPLFLLSPKSLATFRGPGRRWYFRWKSCAHLRAKSRLRRLRSETRLRAQSEGDAAVATA